MALQGIDIASHQATMDVIQVQADFVIVKATQGTGYVNPYCDTHVQQAIASGKLFGVYHYASNGNATAEADYFVDNIRGYIGAGILVLDFESYQNEGNWSGNSNAWIKEFCDRVTELTGVKPMVYIQASALHKVAGIGDYGLWIAQYADNEPTYYQDNPWNEGAYDCAMRQYAGSNGRVEGYNGACDLNKFYGDQKAWMLYANPNGGTPISQSTQVPVQSTQQPQKNVYVVQPGDTLSGIAAMYGTTYQHLAAINGIADPNRIYPGQEIVISGSAPVQASGTEYYTIQPGDTLSAIAARYGTTWQWLAEVNGIENPNLIHPNNTIRVR